MFLPVLLSQDYLPQHLIRYRACLADEPLRQFAEQLRRQREVEVVASVLTLRERSVVLAEQSLVVDAFGTLRQQSPAQRT